jgi:hypothetical protein
MAGRSALRPRAAGSEESAMFTVAQLVGSKLVHMPSRDPYRRDASICLAPTPSNDQLERVAAEMLQAYPDSRISSLSDHMLLVRDIPIVADSDHEADASTWATIFTRATAALAASDDPETRVASIDVRVATAGAAKDE